MPAIPVEGFVLEACGAVVLALILASFQRQRPRAGVPEWSLGMWTLAGALLASVAVGAARPLPSLRQALLVLAVVLAYWAPALVLLGTWARWNDRDVVVLRWRLLAVLALFGAATTLAPGVVPSWRAALPSGVRTLLTAAAQLAAGVWLLRAGSRRAGFGTRLLALSFLGLALENGLFTAVQFRRSGATASILKLPGADILIEGELLLLMLSGVGMVAWLLEEEREHAVRLQGVLQRKEAFSVMGALVAGVAHEVRNPLFGISSNLDALAARIADNAAARPFLATMREQVARLNGLMTELLDYGRPVVGEFTRAPVRPVLAEALAACAPFGARAGVRLEDTTDALGLDGDAWQIRMDRPRLRQAFQNLVQNAVEHAPREGQVLVSLQRETRDERPGLRFSVRDFGPGFAAADLPRVFEPFFSRRRGGTGLGLSIVQRVVEQHGGRVWAANHPDGGGLLTVWLPEAAE